MTFSRSFSDEYNTKLSTKQYRHLDNWIFINVLEFISEKRRVIHEMVFGNSSQNLFSALHAIKISFTYLKKNVTNKSFCSFNMTVLSFISS